MAVNWGLNVDVTSGEASNIDFRQRIIEETDAYVRISAGNAKVSFKLIQHILKQILGRQNLILSAPDVKQLCVISILSLRHHRVGPRYTHIRIRKLPMPGHGKATRKDCPRSYSNVRVSWSNAMVP
jgi:hypothetical protein